MMEPEIESLTDIHAAQDGLGPFLDAEPVVEAAVFPSEAQTASAVEEPVRDWREELAAKMHDYRTRRKPRVPKYPSLQIPLQLPVEVIETFDTFRPGSADISLSANALEPTVQSERVEVQLGPELVEPASVPEPVPAPMPEMPTNLIEFPRSMESEAWDGLAEPIIERPRILDAPELAPPEPALGGILLEAPQEANANSVADLPRPAPISRRLLAAAVDVVLILCATVLWGWLASKITHEFPPRTQLLISAVVAAGVLWLSYQYLLMVYGGTTLGLRACGVELVAMDGTIPGRKQRRWRLLASLLSAASMMLGYAWVLLDENRLCWHDRISHTYLRVRERRF